MAFVLLLKIFYLTTLFEEKIHVFPEVQENNDHLNLSITLEFSYKQSKTYSKVPSLFRAM
jgi:hypothetical protein